MKKDKRFLPELKKAFSKRKSFRKSALRAFYRTLKNDFDENYFRRVFYSLDKEGVIVRVDTDTFIFNKGDRNNKKERKEFEPYLSPDLVSIHNLVKVNFPYTKFSVWETRILSEFMIHQPARNLTVLDVEKDAYESVFNVLSGELAGRVFLDPAREVVENYVIRLFDGVIVVPMISRSPIRIVQGIAYPRLEKILVDLVAGEEHFYIFHGRELTNIYEGAFENYRVRERTLFWYAQRRNVKERILEMINKKTEIRLIQAQETGT